jgi:hypothetical protein
MGREDEGLRLDRYAGVRSHTFGSRSVSSQLSFSMADGLGMSPEEWQELRSQVDDSFWVMRVIGRSIRRSWSWVVFDVMQAIHLYQMITTASPVAPTGEFLIWSECSRTLADSQIMQRLRLSNVCCALKTTSWIIYKVSAHRFLYADPTPSALQVFLRSPGSAKGVWINADPIPGCVVCNIGESKCFQTHL